MPRRESQPSAMAGEFLVVGKLFKKGLQAAITFGNEKSIDILAYNPKNKKNYNVQVKTLREMNCYPIKRERIEPEHVYIFVMLNSFDAQESFFILKGSDIQGNIDKFFGSSYKNAKPSKVPAINCGSLKDYKNNWGVFDS